MGNYELFILVSLSLLTFVVITLAVIWKRKIRKMQGMVISMFFGMNVGLTAGVLLGVTYQGNLYLSTILSIVIGILAGAVCGFCFGLLSVLEGVMAGLMGGMMGAMLGEMINLHESFNLIQIFLFLSISTIFLIVILKTPENSKLKNKRWLIKPLLLALFIAVYMITGHSLAKVNEKVIHPELQHSSHSSTSNNIEEFNNSSQVIAIEALKMEYSKSQIIVEKDRPVTLTLTNLDQVEHDIEIRTSSFSMLKGQKHNHEGNKDFLHLHATPESMDSITFTLTESGVYEFYCTIPGHKELGMIGRIIVS